MNRGIKIHYWGTIASIILSIIGSILYSIEYNEKIFVVYAFSLLFIGGCNIILGIINGMNEFYDKK